MHSQQGMTLIESLVTVILIAILAALALPAFSQFMRSLQVNTASVEIMQALQTTRSYAVKGNRRATLTNHGRWHKGWDIYFDDNNNGVRDSDEPLLATTGALSDKVNITANAPLSHYVSYLGTGASQWATGHTHGGFQAGTLYICPAAGAEPGYQLIVARGGRVRRHAIDAAKCTKGP